MVVALACLFLLCDAGLGCQPAVFPDSSAALYCRLRGFQGNGGDEQVCCKHWPHTYVAYNAVNTLLAPPCLARHFACGHIAASAALTSVDVLLCSFVDGVSVCRAFTAAAVQQAVDSKQLGLTGLRQLLLIYQQQLADVKAIPSTV